MDKIYLGAAYYPELWDEEELEKDIARCKEVGMNCLRIGEFAWGKMEPEEGKFDLSWLVRVVDRLYKNGIFTVLCTPTATPPRWMLNKYPEMRMIMHDLVRADVSSRCQDFARRARKEPPYRHRACEDVRGAQGRLRLAD